MEAHMADENIITNADDAKFLTLSGNKFTVISADGECFVYITGTPSGQTNPHFVREVSSEGEDVYCGTIFDMEKFRTTKAVVDPKCDEVTFFEAFWAQAVIPIGDMEGFHVEPYDTAEKSPSPALAESSTDDSSMAKRAIAMYKLEARLELVEAQLNVVQENLAELIVNTKEEHV